MDNLQRLIKRNQREAAEARRELQLRREKRGSVRWIGGSAVSLEDGPRVRLQALRRQT
jgi:hypothetical protein